jgi:Nucleotidyl transferase AbiEii toxin, Type IV TA system
MIPELQQAYLLELLAALGPAANDFVIAGAQAIKFTLPEARGTKDFDFLLNVIALRGSHLPLANIFGRLGYAPVEGARNFQFEKVIPNRTERMRIEFMAPEELRRRNDFRVEVQEGVHARACTGGSIALAESESHALQGTLPNGEAFSTYVRVTTPHALVMLKLLALFDRYHNIRGPQGARHDREEARTHAADIVAVLKSQLDPAQFTQAFVRQFRPELLLGLRVLRIFHDFFREPTSPGFLVYEEHLAANIATGRDVREELQREVQRNHRVVSRIFPIPEFYGLAAAIDDSCDWERIPKLTEDYLAALENARIRITQAPALQFLPGASFGGAFLRGTILMTSASEAIAKLSAVEREILRAHLRSRAETLQANPGLRSTFPHALQD